MHAASPKGFAAVARDHAEAPLDLHRLMVPRPAATFFMRMQGDAMAPSVRAGDLLVVDRSLSPRSGQPVVAAVDDLFLVRRWEHTPRGDLLRPDNPKHPVLRVDTLAEFRLFGVVTWIVRNAECETRNAE
jgi:DNA polymerase V